MRRVVVCAFGLLVATGCAADSGSSSSSNDGGSSGGSGGTSGGSSGGAAGSQAWPDGGSGTGGASGGSGGSGGGAAGAGASGGSGGSSTGGSGGSNGSGGAGGSGGNTSPGCPSGDGDYCGSAQNSAASDLGTLYVCSGGNWTVKQKCPGSCSVDHCATCPSGGNGLYCGSDGVNGDPNTLYDCQNGQLTAVQVCPGSCTTMPSGTADKCGSCPSGGNGAYCGNDGLGLAADTLYNCQSGVVTVTQKCANGCLVAPSGKADSCYSGGGSSGSCPNGDGLYCGDNNVGGNSNTLYQCSGGTLTEVQHCANGCTHATSGQSDYCTNLCSATANTALQWEATQLSCCSGSWSDWCLKFVYTAYANAGNSISLIASPSAKDALANVEAAGKLTHDENPPCGAILFWAANKCNGYWGHVVIANGDGTVSTSGWPGYAGSTHATIAWLDTMECGQKAAGWFMP